MITAFFISLMACKKEIKDIGAPASKVEGLQANWVLQRCSMVDELSLTKESIKMGDYFTVKNAALTQPNIKFAINALNLSNNMFLDETLRGGPHPVN